MNGIWMISGILALILIGLMVKCGQHACRLLLKIRVHSDRVGGEDQWGSAEH